MQLCRTQDHQEQDRHRGQLHEAAGDMPQPPGLADHIVQDPLPVPVTEPDTALSMFVLFDLWQSSARHRVLRERVSPWFLLS
jgi:hypothetical protein